jgi:predicted transcriptional regulator
MEIHLTPEQERELSQLAVRHGRDANSLAQEAIRRLEEESRFIDAVRRGEEALDRGEYLTHEEVGERLERLLLS